MLHNQNQNFRFALFFLALLLIYLISSCTQTHTYALAMEFIWLSKNNIWLFLCYFRESAAEATQVLYRSTSKWEPNIAGVRFKKFARDASQSLNVCEWKRRRAAAAFKEHHLCLFVWVCVNGFLSLLPMRASFGQYTLFCCHLSLTSHFLPTYFTVFLSVLRSKSSHLF